MINLKNKIALVTGGSRGIGKACVIYLAKAGAEVAFTFNTKKESAKQLCEEVKNISRVKSYRVNIKAADEIPTAVENVIKDFGRIDILVNNAGIWEKGKITKLSLNKWQETIDINLNGTFLFGC